MNRSDEGREEALPAGDLLPPPRSPVPAHPRAGSRTILACTADVLRYQLCRVGLLLDGAIAEEMDDYRHGRLGLEGEAADAYPPDQPDVCLWEGERCLAVIRPRPRGDPEVTRFDGVEDVRPFPTIEAEREIVGLARMYGVERCRRAILDAVLPVGEGELAPPLSDVEKAVLGFIRRHGEGLVIDRLFRIGDAG